MQYHQPLTGCAYPVRGVQLEYHYRENIRRDLQRFFASGTGTLLCNKYRNPLKLSGLANAFMCDVKNCGIDIIIF
jgi:hypothetical protein